MLLIHRNLLKINLLIWVGSVMGWQCNRPVPPLFVELAPEKTGIAFENTLPEQSPNGMNIIQYLYYYNGGGVATGDVNNDGWIDIYFSSNINQNQLFLNKGGFGFEDATAQSGVGGQGSWKTGITMADVNGDGWLDIYVCQVGQYKQFQGKNQLFINRGNSPQGSWQGYEEAAAAYGLAVSAFSTQAAFFDYDLDDDLDCFLLCHSVHSPDSYKDSSISRVYDPLSSDRLFRNDGHVFTNITPKSGLRDGKSGYGLGVCVSDLNNDRYPDIYVANDFHEQDFVYMNVGGKYFKEQSSEAVGHSSNFSMGCDIADFNNDLLPDIITLDMKPEQESILKASAPADPYQIYQFKHDYGYHWQFARNNLQLNQTHDPNKVQFAEIGQLAGVATTDWSWSALFADLDLDGYKDLWITNGIPHRPNDIEYNKFISSAAVQKKASDLELITQMPSGAAANYVFQNQKNLCFKDKSADWGLDKIGFSNGAAYADFDQDGDLDLVVNNLNAKATVYENNVANAHYLKVKLRQKGKNPFAIGAKIQVWANGVVQKVENQPVRGFQSSVEPGCLYIGLGIAHNIDSLWVIWPNGQYEAHRNITADQVLTFEKSGAALPYPDLANRGIGHSVKTTFVTLDSTIGTDILQEKLLPWSMYQGVKPIDYRDANHDGLLDIITTKGFIFQGKNGKFAAQPTAFGITVEAHSQESVVRCADFDNNGCEDRFLGTHFASAAYGIPTNSTLLRGTGTGAYLPEGVALPNLPPSIKDARWADMDGDGRLDLMVAGDWSPIVCYLNKPSGFEHHELSNSEGLWNCLSVPADLDHDGDLDIVAGNRGFNSNLSASIAAPLELWVKDFDGNGSFDPILTYYRQGKSHVLVDKDLLVSQIPMLKKRFVTYKKYADSDFNGIFTKDMLQNTVHYRANTLGSAWLENKGGGQFEMHLLPIEAQMSNVTAALIFDYQNDGHPDILVAGNMLEVQPYIGRIDAGDGQLLVGDGKGGFKPLPVTLGLRGRVTDLYEWKPGEILVVR